MVWHERLLHADEEGFVGDTGDIHLVFRGREVSAPISARFNTF